MKFFSSICVWEAATILAFMFFGVAGAIPGIAPNQANEMTGAAATGLQTVAGIGSQLAIDVLIAGMLARNCRLFTATAAKLRWPCLLACWTLLSVFWSQDPILTARRAIPFALATGFGVLLALQLPQRRFLSLLQASFALLACWSAALALGFPAIGLDASTGHGGDWQGVFTQKNACGRAMVFALASVLASGKLSLLRAGFLLLFVVELILSGSRGAWVLGCVLFAAIAGFGMSCRFDHRTRTALIGGAAWLLLGGAVVTSVFFEALAPLLGRAAPRTGRTAIWHEVWLAILHRPWLGYGFSAFWRGAQGASWDVVVALRFVLFHAHNGFLEIWLELGAGGLLLFALGFIRAAVLLWPELRAGQFREAAWPFSTLLLILLYDFDENTVLSFNDLFWVLYTAALTRIEVLAAERRLVQRSGPNAKNPVPDALPLLEKQLGFVSGPAFLTAYKPAGTYASRSPWL